MRRAWVWAVGGLLTGAVILSVGAVRNAAAQTNIYTYPNVRQSQEQQTRDRAECHTWVVQQTGIDPLAPQAGTVAPPTRSPPSGSSSGVFGLGEGGMFRGGGLLGDAATGAGLGAAGGALAGNAGKGAAIGALAGALLGSVHRKAREQEREAWREEQRWRAQHQQQWTAQVRAQGTDDYRRAFAACMSARNYTVR